MSGRLSFLVLLLWGLQLPAADSFPQRIVALTPHLVESLFAVGAGDRLVGVVEYSDFPEAAKSIPRVGDSRALDLERILALRPDLVVVWSGWVDAEVLERLRRLGLRIHLSSAETPEEIADELEALGRLTGHAGEARRAAAEFRQRLGRLRRAHRSLPPLRVFYQIWDRPLITTGGGTFLDRAITLCGGRNLFGDLSDTAPSVSVEAVLARRPEVITGGAKGEKAVRWREQWRHWLGGESGRGAPARVEFLDPDLLHRPGPRFIEGLERLCDVLDGARADG